MAMLTSTATGAPFAYTVTVLYGISVSTQSLTTRILQFGCSLALFSAVMLIMNLKTTYITSGAGSERLETGKPGKVQALTVPRLTVPVILQVISELVLIDLDSF